MTERKRRMTYVSCTLIGCLMAVLAPSANGDGFVPEPMGQVTTLPTPYPSHWILALDSSFFHMLEGQVVVLDPLAKDIAGQHKGMYTASFMAATAQSKRRNEHYVAETFFSRHGRGGKRTDVVAIYDPATLSLISEIEIPPKRLGGNPKRIAMQLTNDHRFLLVYNFTPAQSVSVVDLEARAFVGEIDIAGCAFVIPTGKRGFSSICANGTLLSTTLDNTGKPAGSSRTDTVMNVNDDPAFEAYGQSGNIGYFPTFKGNILPIKLSGKSAQPRPMWSLVNPEEAAAGWRPGGALPITHDNNGKLYVLMHPNGKEGSHKDGGSEVWVYNAGKKRREHKIVLNTTGISLGMTGGDGRQLLTVVNTELGIDIYDAKTGEYVNKIVANLDTPFLVDGAN